MHTCSVCFSYFQLNVNLGLKHTPNSTSLSFLSCYSISKNQVSSMIEEFELTGRMVKNIFHAGRKFGDDIILLKGAKQLGKS